MSRDKLVALPLRNLQRIAAVLCFRLPALLLSRHPLLLSSRHPDRSELDPLPVLVAVAEKSRTKRARSSKPVRKKAQWSAPQDDDVSGTQYEDFAGSDSDSGDDNDKDDEGDYHGDEDDRRQWPRAIARGLQRLGPLVSRKYFSTAFVADWKRSSLMQ
ncbi:hypothetical protein LTR35_006126 [Friedmanniomyces endolithicus]|nr:hypothetical protein LTR35_006126 [Friedmanniomyces endolithicus]KAK0301399.1 hypothetical protein LTS00_000548 [Friedmanniomyces endolithicus]KAK1014416.1 hypothetical protein LTR54_004068 [Friedmanniomyces endolithicus]